MCCEVNLLWSISFYKRGGRATWSTNYQGSGTDGADTVNRTLLLCRSKLIAHTCAWHPFLSTRRDSGNSCLVKAHRTMGWSPESDVYGMSESSSAPLIATHTSQICCKRLSSCMAASVWSWPSKNAQLHLHSSCSASSCMTWVYGDDDQHPTQTRDTHSTPKSHP